MSVVVGEILKAFGGRKDNFPGDPERQIPFPDPTLERLVRKAIGIPTCPIKRSALWSLASLEARSAQVAGTVKSLVGMHECGELEKLALHDLWGGTSLRPLARLGRLTTLEVGIDDERMLLHGSASYPNRNGIRDLSPLSQLGRLRRLTLNHQSIADLAPLESIRGLEELNLSRNQIENVEPLATLKRLTKLNLTYNCIQDISPISNLANLEIAYLYGNPIRDLRPLAERIQTGGRLGSRPKREYEQFACELILDVEQCKDNDLAVELLKDKGIKVTSSDLSDFYSSY